MTDAATAKIDLHELGSMYADVEEEILQRARAHGPMTREERREQIINYVFGEIGERCNLSRDQVAVILDR